jgi:glycosyltransferase involved in cell wall biosynthesis
MNARKNSQRSLELKLIGRNGRMFADLEGITYLGELQQTEIPEALTLCEALVSASNAESFGLTIAEAATLGVPSIVVSGSASSELLEDSTTGWVVQDFEELTSLFVRLSKQDQQAHSVLGLAAKAKAVVKYSPGAVSDLYAKVYEEIL